MGRMPASQWDGRKNWADRINSALFPWIGPPPLGPYHQPAEQPVAERSCPLCAQVMSLHVIEERPTRPTKVHCPAA